MYDTLKAAKVVQEIYDSAVTDAEVYAVYRETSKKYFVNDLITPLRTVSDINTFVQTLIFVYYNNQTICTFKVFSSFDKWDPLVSVARQNPMDLVRLLVLIYVMDSACKVTKNSPDSDQTYKYLMHKYRTQKDRKYGARDPFHIIKAVSVFYLKPFGDHVWLLNANIIEAMFQEFILHGFTKNVRNAFAMLGNIHDTICNPGETNVAKLRSDLSPNYVNLYWTWNMVFILRTFECKEWVVAKLLVPEFYTSHISNWMGIRIFTLRMAIACSVSDQVHKYTGVYDWTDFIKHFERHSTYYGHASHLVTPRTPTLFSFVFNGMIKSFTEMVITTFAIMQYIYSRTIFPRMLFDFISPMPHRPLS